MLTVLRLSGAESTCVCPADLWKVKKGQKILDSDGSSCEVLNVIRNGQDVTITI